MSDAIVAELDTSLQALNNLKPPGITKSTIAAVTTLCVQNIKLESKVVGRIYTHFKRTLGSHKLGVLYIVDAIVRQWMEKANASGQNIAEGVNTEGTFAAGVARITELLPIMMSDVIKAGPYDQIDRVLKLVDIWQRASTFPAALLADVKAKLMIKNDARPSVSQETPPGRQSPKAVIQSVQPTPLPVPKGRNAQDILSGLTALQNQATVAPSTVLPPTSLAASQIQAQPTPVAAPVMTNPIQAPSLAVPNIQHNVVADIDINNIEVLLSVLPAGCQNDGQLVIKYMKILEELKARNVPFDQWAEVLYAMHHGIIPGMGPVTSQAGRDRSRSPAKTHEGALGYGYEQGNYRDRSPPKDIDSYGARARPAGQLPRWTSNNMALPPGCIQVLSRTLFIGGVATGVTEDKLRAMFGKLGEVQTCIVSQEKHHAFVKMCTRAGAVAGREGKERSQDFDFMMNIRSIKWGVGFGPRDCFDYQSGVSVIEIERLTEADRKWALTAEYGGTGGIPITAGLVMEEPDIEIGAGVSSKSMSARNDPHARRGRDFNRGEQRGRR